MCDEVDMKDRIESLILCENIRRLRKSEGLSKNKMAKILGISVKSLNSLEKSIIPKRLGLEVLIRIRNTFGILPKDILSKII